MMAKKPQEPTFWSKSANGKSTSGGSGYGQRNKRKQTSGQGCVVALRWLS